MLVLFIITLFIEFFTKENINVNINLFFYFLIGLFVAIIALEKITSKNTHLLSN